MTYFNSSQTKDSSRITGQIDMLKKFLIKHDNSNYSGDLSRGIDKAESLSRCKAYQLRMRSSNAVQKFFKTSFRAVSCVSDV